MPRALFQSCVRPVLVPLAAMLLLATTGCEDKRGSPVPAGQQMAIQQSGTGVKDLSLDVAEYIKAGMPSPDREWSGTEMQAAAAVISKMGAEHPEQLPHFASLRSGEVFASLCSSTVPGMFLNTTLPFRSRFDSALQYFNSLNSINKVYLSRLQAGRGTPRDFVELLGGLLRVTHLMLDLLDEFMSTLPSDDPQRNARMQGLDQMRAGMASIVSGCLTTLTEQSIYPAADRLALIGHLQENLPSILPRLSESARLELVTRIKSMASDDGLRELRPAIEELREVVTREERGG